MREAELSVNFNSKSLWLYDKIFTTSDVRTYFRPIVNKYKLYLLFNLCPNLFTNVFTKG